MRLITAVMVTGLARGNLKLPAMAVECFQNQTYPRKELLIINHGQQDYSGPNVREFKIKKEPDEHIGALRNLAFDLAHGDYLMTWDDDDWQAPDRMEYQAMRTPDKFASVLKNRIAYDFHGDRSFYREHLAGFGSSLFYPKNVPQRYENWLRDSDARFRALLKQMIRLNNPPSLYVRMSHGKNLTPRETGVIYGNPKPLIDCDQKLVGKIVTGLSP